MEDAVPDPLYEDIEKFRSNNKLAMNLRPRSLNALQGSPVITGQRKTRSASVDQSQMRACASTPSGLSTMDETSCLPGLSMRNRAPCPPPSSNPSAPPRRRESSPFLHQDANNLPDRINSRRQSTPIPEIGFAPFHQPSVWKQPVDSRLPSSFLGHSSICEAHTCPVSDMPVGVPQYPAGPIPQYPANSMHPGSLPYYPGPPIHQMYYTTDAAHPGAPHLYYPNQPHMQRAYIPQLSQNVPPVSFTNATNGPVMHQKYLPCQESGFDVESTAAMVVPMPMVDANCIQSQAADQNQSSNTVDDASLRIADASDNPALLANKPLQDDASLNTADDTESLQDLVDSSTGQEISQCQEKSQQKSVSQLPDSEKCIEDNSTYSAKDSIVNDEIH